MLAALGGDIRYALRSLAARPAYAVVVLLTVAVIVGPSASVLAVLNATLVRSMPFPDSDRLVQLYLFPPGVSGRPNRNPLGSLDFVRMRQNVRQADLAGIWAQQRAVESDDEPESVATGSVSSNFFHVLGAEPLHGRTFTEQEDRANAKVAVLAYGLWKRRFGGDPATVGKRITIDRETYDVVGVMGPGFNPGYVVSELWTPLGVYDGHLILPQATFIQTIARLQAGVTPEQLNQEASAVMQTVGKEQPDMRGGWTVDIGTLRDQQFGRIRPALFVLLAAIAALALVACANLTNLTLAEVANRRGEIAVRAALGASRADLLRGQLVESAMLAAGGGIAGLILAAWMMPVTLALDPATALLLGKVPLDGRVQAGAIALALAVGLVAGGWPTIVATSGDVASALITAGRRLTGSRSQRLLRFAMIAVECALVVVLLSAGALLSNAFSQSARTDPGFDPSHLLVVQLRLAASAYGQAEKRVSLVQSVLDEVRSVPGVVDASTTQNPFIPGFSFVSGIQLDGRPSPDGKPYTVHFRRISPGYFRTMKIPELRGRTFDEHDDAAAMPAAVVSKLFADQYWPGEDAIGKRLYRPAEPKKLITVVGIVGDVSDVGFSQPPAATLYFAYAQNNPVTASIGLVIRTAGEPLESSRAIAGAVHRVDPAQPLSSITTADRFLSDSLGSDRFRTVVMALFAGLGLLLAAVGIYGMTSRGVAERTREIGVRLALGARPADIRWLTLRQSLASVAIGFACGVPAAVATIIALQHWLTGIGTAPAGVVVAAPAALIVAGLVAVAGPALRAGGVRPIDALKE